ncbi:DUF6308 family protein [Rhodococcus jostii]|uniref:DUF6308 family protein n=1 Tax=Rhodococcus jostii TaxID=132919 RepID=UPI000AD0B1A2|nr:DUF6308 family protein [Rhodococcus jostii]
MQGSEATGRSRTIREEAGLPEKISTVRVFDVIAWMDGKDAAWVSALTWVGDTSRGDPS